MFVSFEMVGQVIGLVIGDNNEITSKGEQKWFWFEFESVGATTW